MRLLEYNNGKVFLTKDLNRDIPRYATLSHTWGSDEEEVTYRDLIDCTGENKAGYEKIKFCAEQARRDGLRFFWIDTCCIDKSNYTELHEAINSMFRWYQNADRCYVFLADVTTPNPDIGSNDSLKSSHLKEQNFDKPETSPSSTQPGLLWEAALRRSRWFTRGWTLQELVAPVSVEFFTKQGHWLGDKSSLEQEIHQITGIPILALRGAHLSEFDVEERFRWAEGRQTTREEDWAYCLLGIFDVFMPLIYGEGKSNAVRRLRKKTEKVKHHTWQELKPTMTIPFNRDPDFVDRSDILGRIDEQCFKRADRTALVGLGGVGKSQLAIEFAYRIDRKPVEVWVFWVHASTRARLEEGFRMIADVVKLPGREEPKADILQLLYIWLSQERNGRWIIIFDSADDADVFFGTMASPESKPLASYIPQSRNGSILVTTRNRDLARRLTGSTDIIEVGTMSEAEALSLLEKKIGVITDLDAATELVSALDYVPLAINQAAGYIQARAPRSSVQKYLADFRESERKRCRLLGYDGGDLRRDGSASNGVLTTWQISFEHIYSRRRSAAELMSLMSFFDRHNIPELLLKPAASATIIDGDEESDFENSQGLVDDEFEDDVAMLKDFHLIKVNENGIEFEMHRLVQLSTRKWLENQGLQEQFKEEYLTRLEASFPDVDHLKNWEACRKLFPHVEKAIEYKPTGEKLEETWAALLTSGAWFALSQGRLVEAERMAHKTRRSYERLLGEEHKTTLSAVFLFASVLLDKGQWTDAEELFVQILETRKHMLGIDHPDTLAAMSNLASIYRIRGRWEDAEKLQVQVMEAQGRMKKFGADYSDTLTIMNNLALTYVSQGRWDDAEKLQLQVVEAGSMKLGIGHPGHLTELNNLALTYMGQNRWKDAEKLEVQVVDGRKMTLGADHPDTLASMNNLASIYANQGRCDDAEELFLEIIKTHKAKLGFDHPNTLTNMANLATTYRYQGRFKEAEQLHTQVLEACKAKLGIDHPDTLTSMASLAYDWKRLGRHADALALMESCVRGRQRILGPEHPQTCSSIASIREWNADAEN